MSDREIDDVLKQAARASENVDSTLLNRVSESIGASLRPVRPLPAPWLLVAGLITIAVAVAVVGAMVLGPHGIQRMNALEIGLIFPLLGALIWAAAALSVAEVIPGSQRPASPRKLAVGGCVALGLVFAILFHDYRTPRFIPQGMACLIAGLAHAIPTSVAAWWLLSRGFAVNPVAAGWAKGILAGLAGVTMLELHCANFEAPHVIVWHIAVIPVSGAIAAWVARSRAHRRHLAG